MVGGDQVRVDCEPQYSKTVVEVVLPDRRVPVGGPAFQQFAAPDVVDEHVDVAVLLPNPIGEMFDLFRVEMIDCGGDTGAAKLGHQSRPSPRSFRRGCIRTAWFVSCGRCR